MPEPDVLSPSHSGTEDRPTSVRYLVLGIAFLVSALLYLHRFTITYVQQYVREDLGLSTDQLAWCLSAFSLVYALAQVPSGWLSGRFGSRWMLAIYILVWSGFTASMGLVTGFVGLLLVRAAAGLGQAGAYPTCGAVVGRWAPFSVRAAYSSVIAAGGRLAAAAAPIVTSFLIVAFVPGLTLEDSQLKPTDLLDSGYLAEQLELSGQPLEKPSNEALAQQALAAKIRAELPTDVQERLADLRTAYLAAQELPEEQDSEAKAPPPPPRKFRDGPLKNPLGKSTNVSFLAEALNQVVSGPLLASAAEAQNISVEREAQRLWNASHLTEPQTMRLNRLLVEAVFPAAIRKVYGGGWRRVMFFLGSIGIAAALVWFLIVRNSPGEHPWVNPSESQLISGGNIVPSTATHQAPLPWRVMLFSPSLWNMSISQFGTNFGWVFLVSWLPRYLQEVYRVPFEDRNEMACAIMLIGSVGMFFGGWTTDRLTKAMGQKIGRSWPLGMSRFVGAVAFAAMLLHPSVWTATILFSVVAFTTDFGNPPMWAYSQDVGGRHTAAILGWSNMWGNFGAALSPVVLNKLLGAQGGNWDLVFTACCVAFVIAGITGMSVDSTKKIDFGEEA